MTEAITEPEAMWDPLVPWSAAFRDALEAFDAAMRTGDQVAISAHETALQEAAMWVVDHVPTGPAGFVAQAVAVATLAKAAASQHTELTAAVMAYRGAMNLLTALENATGLPREFYGGAEYVERDNTALRGPYDTVN